MVPELAPELVHVLAYWVYLHAPEESDITPSSRQEIVRFALFWRLCCFNDTKASRHALKYLKDTRNVSPKTDFPGKALYGLLTEPGQDRCADNLFLPKAMRAYSNSARGGKSKAGWLSWKDRFERVDPIQDLFRKWWYTDGKMLLWLQRSYFFETFLHYDPSSGRDDDKPYDLDHICARKTWLNSIYKGRTGDDDESLCKTAWDGRHILGEGIGNLWWIDSRVNRGLGDASIASKLAVGELKRVIAKAFDDASLPQWRTASVEENEWNALARKEFQVAVEERTLWLYERFFYKLGFEAWLGSSPSNQATHMSAADAPLLVQSE
jgi:hypothetical protein